MKCEDYKQWLPDWHMGRLGNAEKEELEQHLNSCDICREALAATALVLDNISGLPDPTPSAQMAVNFRGMLDDFKAAEKQPAATNDFWSRLKRSWASQPRFPLAYCLMILLIFDCMVYWFSRNSEQEKEVQELHAQVHELKQTMMLAMLDNPLASERLKAVNYTGEMKRVDHNVIVALLATLNNDPNDNVRLSTLEALARLANNPEVRTGLIQSITKQDSPIIQLAIADVMLKLQVKGSISAFKQLLKQKGLDENVRDKVKETITKLI
ncbi:MAG TPA: HEAT repeat domain-containing protein [Mucilaginibacter sp.]